MHLEGVVGSLGRVVAPERSHEVGDGDGAAGAQCQGREQGALSRPAERQGGLARVGLGDPGAEEANAWHPVHAPIVARVAPPSHTLQWSLSLLGEDWLSL